MVQYSSSQTDWYEQSIFGDQISIELIPNAQGEMGQFEIDFYMACKETATRFESNNTTLSTCGVNERKDVACWQDSHADKVAWSSPVARLLINGRSLCTAWRVGSDNKLFTNNHCVSSEAELKNTEVWFNYQRSTCNGTLSSTVKVMGDQLFSADYTLDYTLFSVDDFSKIEPFGYLGLDNSESIYGNGIYIPQHGAGNPKELAIESGQNGSGYCQIDVTSANERGINTDAGYFCDTIGGCENQGVKISKIWPQVSKFFNNTLPEGSVGEPSNGIQELVSGTPVTGVTLSKGEQQMWLVKAQNRTTPLNVTISSGSGDADLYVHSGAQPTTSSYDCRPYLSGSNESCSAAIVGEYLYIMLRAYM